MAVASTLAAHLAVAMASSSEISNLNSAVLGRTVIGQAEGILMERYDLDAEGAFAVLRRYSQHGNRKLRDVATELVEQRGKPGQPLGL